MHNSETYTLLKLPVAGKRKGKAFTLVELLIVVGIIALLVTIIMPSLGRAKDLAKKAVCASQINSYGKSMALYVTDYDSYPIFGDTRFQAAGQCYPKFYGLLLAMEVAPPQMVNGGNLWFPILAADYSVWELDEVPDGCFCPSMDVVRILQASDRAMATGLNPAEKPSLHRAAAGYQWNKTLRAAGKDMPEIRGGRWPTASWQPPADWQGWDNTHWFNMYLRYPDDISRIAQAVRPDEIEQPARVAEAWDGWDIESVPELNWADPQYNLAWSWEDLVPGWNVGPYSDSGWALLNGLRHPSSPNLLYADGHCDADATRELTASQCGSLPGSASWKGAKVNSWNIFDESFGTLSYIVPERGFTDSGK